MATKVPTITPDLTGAIRNPGPVRLPLGMDTGIGAEAAGQEDLAKAVGAASGEVYDAYKEQSHTRVLAATNQLSTWKAEEINGKLLQTKGGEALGIKDKGLSGYDEQAKAIAETLDPVQRKDFNEQGI